MTTNDTTPPSTPPTPSSPSHPSTLDDIFSSSPSTSPSLTPHLHDHHDNHHHPSEIPRLRAIHSTAGYREGISHSKALSLQPGFDEGYPLGATFGLRVGILLGTLKGTLAASRQKGSTQEGKQREVRLEKMLREAQAALAVEKVFGRDVWREDGMWGYHVPGHGGEEGSDAVGTGDREGEESFEQVVESHPLMREWVKRVEGEVGSLGGGLGLHGG